MSYRPSVQGCHGPLAGIANAVHVLATWNDLARGEKQAASAVRLRRSRNQSTVVMARDTKTTGSAEPHGGKERLTREKTKRKIV